MKKLSILLIIVLLTCLTLTAFATKEDVFEEGSIGKWVRDTRINPIDDTTTITFRLVSDSGRSTYGKPIS